ncbi:MAG: NADH-quinone oxidoreductase subunit L [Phycisphaerales bacterium]|nr:NADH-quinone oxidoreductase subunit L [Phycisphaerales bacterium]
MINTTLLSNLLAFAPDTHAATTHATDHAIAATEVGTGPKWILLIVGLPLLSSILSLVYAMIGNKTKLPAWTTVAAAGTAFLCTIAMYLNFDGTPYTVHAFDWIQVHFGEKSMIANFSFYIDTLTIYWMLFVTGLATCIALYASEYMSHDIGTSYCRFFGAFGLFVFSMACLVMGDNFLMLYLGWEGVGLCSYLLIGYFYKKPEAVAAAKKAFIVNRIGDLGLALGIYLIFVHFGTLEYAVLFSDPKLLGYVDSAMTGNFAAIPAIAQWIPLLLMIGAFGKSAQFPLYVWLPDAMEGPTPVSALIHAATMVTAGVYLIARTYPLFLASESALPIVAWIGTITALLAATIGMAQFDIKRIMAYSTVSQLGYMFAGLGVLTPTGGAYHVLTHAFFKALLFLCCGAVMHGFAGQLDLRKLSGLRKVKGWGIVSLGMFVGCINLAGVPFTAGYFSKDTIIAETFVTPGYSMIGWILLFTAGLTAYYTFRVFFRVFMGPVEYHPGEEHHDDDHGHDDHAEDHGHAGDFHPHAPGWAINTVLMILTVCSIAATGLYFVGGDKDAHTKHYAQTMVMSSTAAFESPYSEHAIHAAHEAHTPNAGAGPRGTIDHALEVPVFGGDPHKMMYYISAGFGIVGIALAWFLHLFGRTNAAECKMDPIARMFGPIPKWAENKWYVDEIYWAILVTPLRVASHIFHWIDKLLVDGIVNLFGILPRVFAWVIRPSQSGVLQGYAVSMAGGIAILLLAVFVIILQGGAS